MEISGSHRIPAPRDAVWAALDDPSILKACIPSCTRLEKTGEDAFAGAAEAKVGPVKALFEGTCERVDASTPDRFALVGGADGGAAGGATGRADLTLTADGDGTIVVYEAKADVTGKIGQLGSRLINGFARKNAETFFEALAARIGAETTPVVPDPELPEPELLATEPPALADAPPLVHEEPAEAPVVTEDAPPPLAFGGAISPHPIAPTGVPQAIDPAEIAAEETVSPGSSSASAVTRIMLVAAIVAVVGSLIYYMLWQAPV